MIKWIKDVLGIGRSKKQTNIILEEIRNTNFHLAELDLKVQEVKNTYIRNSKQQEEEKKETVKKNKKLEKVLYEVLEVSRQSEQNIAMLDSNMNEMYSELNLKFDNSFNQLGSVLQALVPIIDKLTEKVDGINTNIHALSEDVNYVAGFVDRTSPIINQMKTDIDKLANQKTVVASNYSQLQEYVDTSSSIGPYDDVMQRNKAAEERLQMLQDMEVDSNGDYDEWFDEETSTDHVQQTPSVQQTQTRNSGRRKRQTSTKPTSTSTSKKSNMEQSGRVKRTEDGGLFCNYNGMSGKDLNNQ